MSILICNGLVLTLDDQDHIYESRDVLIEGDRIVQVGGQIAAPRVEQVIDASGHLVMPGLNVAHAHSFAQLFKGVFDGLPLDVWILDTNAPPLGWTSSPRQNYLRTLLGAAELIRSGATTIWDDLLLAPDLQDTFFHAYGESGLRAYITATMYDKRIPDRTLHLRQSLPPEMLGSLLGENMLTPDEWIATAEQIYQKWHGQVGRLNFAVSVAWPQGSSDEMISKGFALAEKYNLPFVTHVLETKVQQATGPVLYGKSIVAHLDELGVLAPRTSIVHGIWVSDVDIEILGRNQVTVLHNPVSNLILGSGIMPMRRLMQAGVNIALGVDEGLQTQWNPFEMMKTAALMQKIGGSAAPDWPTSHEILSMATRGGARSELAEREIGALAPGMKADVIVLDLNSLPFTPLNHLKNQLVYLEPGTSVVTSIINGKLVMQDRRILTFDLDALLAEVGEMMPAYWKMHQERRTLEFPRKLRPYVEAIYRKVVEAPSGINRWVGDEREWVKGKAVHE